MSVLDEIRAAVKASGKTQQELADAVGINLVSLNRFIKGHRGLSFETADKLAGVLGIQIVTKRRRK